MYTDREVDALNSKPPREVDGSKHSSLSVGSVETPAERERWKKHKLRALWLSTDKDVDRYTVVDRQR